MVYICLCIMMSFFFTFTGYCTEYSFSGNMIQQNIRTECQTFKKNPCPMYYRSTEAYKCEFISFFFSQMHARARTDTHMHNTIRFSQWYKADRYHRFWKWKIYSKYWHSAKKSIILSSAVIAEYLKRLSNLILILLTYQHVYYFIFSPRRVGKWGSCREPSKFFT